eukprot:2517152-Pleurochrysis_carterae.AAC.5
MKATKPISGTEPHTTKELKQIAPDFQWSPSFPERAQAQVGGKTNRTTHTCKEQSRRYFRIRHLSLSKKT